MSEGFALPKPTKRSKTPGARPGGNKYKARATKDEGKVARRLTAATGIPFERVPMSGARKHVGLDGDVRSKATVREWAQRWLLELKNKEVTNAKGQRIVSLDLEWLNQLQREAAENGALPALVYRYTGDTRLWVVTEMDTFERLLRELRQLSEEPTP